MLAGQYHDFEIRKDIDQLDWYGLYIDENGTATLRKCELGIELVDDPVAGDVPGKSIFARVKKSPSRCFMGLAGYRNVH